MAVRHSKDNGNETMGLRIDTDLPDSIGVSEAELDLLEPYLMDLVADMLNTLDLESS